MCTTPFRGLSEARRKSLGRPDLPVVYLPHPMMTRTPAEIGRIADEFVDEIGRLLTGAGASDASSPGAATTAPATAAAAANRAGLLQVDADPWAFFSWLESSGHGDGLPVIPPVPELVAAMVAGSGLAPETPVASIAPAGTLATVEKIAANAVMAGCKPDYMPVLLAAVRALAQPRFNLAGIQGTTHPVAPLVLVNGPIRHRLALNCGSNVFGQGWRANATIGRAVRLILINLGGGLPGITDMATHGSPAKFSFCIGENEEESPWEPFHVEHGLQAGDDAVLVHGGEPPHNLQDHGSANAAELLLTLVSGMATVANNNAGLGGEMLLVLSPEHARILAQDGMSKNDVRQELHRRMRLRFADLGKGSRDFYRHRRPSTDLGPEVAEIAYFDDPAQILIVVAGGPGLHSAVLPSFGGMSWSTRERIG